MKFKTKLILSFMMISGVTGSIGLLSIYELSIIEKSTHDIPEKIQEINSSSELDHHTQLIRYYDEVLTQSARNYAFTQDKFWADRYMEYEPLLDAEINHAIADGDEIITQLFKDVDVANKNLVSMEYQSIELVNQGNFQDAINILQSQKYSDDKTLYEQALRTYIENKGIAYLDTLTTSTVEIKKSVEDVSKSIFSALVILSIVTPIVIGTLIAFGITISHSVTNTIHKTEKAKSEFISMITHELKTPLQPIHGYTHMLEEEELGSLNEKQLNAIKEISSSSTELLHLIENLLTAQKLEMKEQEFHNATIPLKEFAESIHRSLLPLMSEKNINFINLVNVDSAVTADPVRLKEIFANLIQNSIDFVEPQNGKISFGVFDETADKVILYVKDNGKGIPKEFQKNIFKKFWQVDSSLSRKHGGTGLGLSICHEYLKQMNGNLWVKSKPGVETIFYFNLPKSR